MLVVRMQKNACQYCQYCQFEGYKGRKNQETDKTDKTDKANFYTSGMTCRATKEEDAELMYRGTTKKEKPLGR